MTIPYQTRHTLLQRVSDEENHSAWGEFVEHYKRFIFYVLNQIGVPQREAEDISQKVLIALTDSIPRYDRSKGLFRTWLSSVIRNTAINHLKSEQSYQRRIEKLGDPSYLDELQNAGEIDQFIEDEWATYISSQAMARVRHVFKGRAIEVFERSLDGQDTDTIAAQTGLTKSAVYTLRKRVKKRLYLEILALTEELEP